MSSSVRLRFINLPTYWAWGSQLNLVDNSPSGLTLIAISTLLIGKSSNHKWCLACRLASSPPPASSSPSSSSTYCEFTALHPISKQCMMRQIVWGSWNTSKFNQFEFCCRCTSGCFKNTPTSDDPNFTAQRANNKLCDSFLVLQNNRWNIRQLFSRSWRRES